MQTIRSISVDSESHSIPFVGSYGTHSTSSISSIDTVPINVATNTNQYHLSSESKEEHLISKSIPIPIPIPKPKTTHQRLFPDQNRIWKYKRETRTYSADGDIDEDLVSHKRQDTPRIELPRSREATYEKRKRKTPSPTQFRKLLQETNVQIQGIAASCNRKQSHK